MAFAFSQLKFIDQIAGLGGFHQALKELDAGCVFASEIDSELASLYENNFGISPDRDNCDIEIALIPDHDVLCAGFPCQPFSKAGERMRLQCPQSNNLIDYVIKGLQEKEPRFFIIENVPNLFNHYDGKTWGITFSRLHRLNHNVDHSCRSLHMFGIPQKRKRAFIIGDRNGLDDFFWPSANEYAKFSITSVLDDAPEEALDLSSDHIKYQSVWQELLIVFLEEIQLPSFPIRAMDFGASYPLNGPAPYGCGFSYLRGFKGASGQSLHGLTPEETEAALPVHTRTNREHFPTWKVDYIKKNRAFYAARKSVVDPCIDQINPYPSSVQKLEWNVRGGERNIWKQIIQFRASGIRIKRADTAPSLFAMTTSQVPIIGWLRRCMTPNEGSRRQSLEIQHLPDTKTGAYKALGNAVIVEVVKRIIAALFNREGDMKRLQRLVAA